MARKNPGFTGSAVHSARSQFHPTMKSTGEIAVSTLLVSRSRLGARGSVTRSCSPSPDLNQVAPTSRLAGDYDGVRGIPQPTEPTISRVRAFAKRIASITANVRQPLWGDLLS